MIDRPASGSSPFGVATFESFLAKAMPGLGAKVREGDYRLDEVQAAASSLVATEYPGASCAILYGSILRGAGKPLSDIDVLIVTDGPPGGLKRYTMHAGYPFDLQIFDLATLRRALTQSYLTRKPYLPIAIREGLVCFGDHEVLASLNEMCRDLSGRDKPPPEPCPPLLRAQVTSLIMGLATAPIYEDQFRLALQLYILLPSLLLRQFTSWFHAPKWAFGLMHELDPDLSDRFEQSFRRLTGDREVTPFILSSIEILDGIGGPLWAGLSAVSFEQ